MPKGKIVLISLGAVVIGIIGIAALLGTWGSNQDSPAQQVPDSGAGVNLGITYLALNPMIAECYELEITSGALVTNVDPNSLAYQAGVRIDDIILSCDGVEVSESTPLLGVIREHHRTAGKINFEVLRATGIQVIEIPFP